VTDFFLFLQVMNLRSRRAGTLMDQRVTKSCSKENSRLYWAEVLRHIVCVAGNLNLFLNYDTLCMDMCHTFATARGDNCDPSYTLNKESYLLP